MVQGCLYIHPFRVFCFYYFHFTITYQAETCYECSFFVDNSTSCCNLDLAGVLPLNLKMNVIWRLLYIFV